MNVGFILPKCWIGLLWLIIHTNLTAFLLCPAAAEPTQKHLFYQGLDVAFDGLYSTEGYDYTLPFKNGRDEGIVRITSTQGIGFFPSPVSVTGMAISRYLHTRLLGGIQFQQGAADLKVFAGFDIIDKQTFPFLADPHGGLRVGPTLAASLWWTFHQHGMLNLEASYTTALNSLNLRLATGITWPEGVSFGPEVGLSTQGETLRLRAGLHLTGVAVMDFKIRLQSGYARNDNGSQGFYGAISSWQRF